MTVCYNHCENVFCKLLIINIYKLYKLLSNKFLSLSSKFPSKKFGGNLAVGVHLQHISQWKVLILKQTTK